MPLYSFKELKPTYGANFYCAPGARIIGRVQLGDDVSVWHNCVLRGDVNQITIGHKTNIQDLSMLHVTSEYALTIDENVTIGHSVTLHGCSIHKNCLIGMGATLLDDCEIGEFSIVAAHSLVPQGKKYPANSLIMGSPAKVVRQLKTHEIDMLKKHYMSYVGYKNEFIAHEKKID